MGAQVASNLKMVTYAVSLRQLVCCLYKKRNAEDKEEEPYAQSLNNSI